MIPLDWTPWVLVLALLVAGTPAAAQPPDNATCKPGTMAYPVVDMHVHVFNFRYLPLRGILYRFHLPYFLANTLADVLVQSTARTESAPVSRVQALGTRNLIASDPKQAIEQRLRAAGQLERLQRRRKAMLDYVVDGIEAEQSAAGEGSMSPSSAAPGARAGARAGILSDYFLTGAGPGAAGSAERAAGADARSIEQQLSGFDDLDLLLGILKKAFDVRDVRGPSATPSIADPVTGFIRMIRILMMNEREMLDYLAGEYCEVDLFVHHMMDMEKVYNDRPDYPFSSQVDRIAGALRQRRRDDFVTFVAHDPFRLDPQYALLEQALAKGAAGIKYYPPSGYSPSDMAVPPKPGFWVLPLVSQWKVRGQWRSRYGKLRKPRTLRTWEPFIPNVRDLDRARTLDEMNKHFFRWAQARDVPLFSHHTPQGFQAQPDYGRRFAAPCRWGEVLMGEDGRASEFADLRLVLAHAGGGAHWFSDPDDAGWRGSFEQQAYNLCVLFENVYCDFGFHNEVLDPRLRDNFRTRLRRLAARPRTTDPGAIDGHPLNPEARVDLCAYDEDAEPVYDIRAKLLYGSDWMLVTRLRDRDFISSFRTVFVGAHLEGWDDEFFGGNALRLLGITGR